MALPAEFFYFTRSPATGDASIFRTPAVSVLSTSELAAQGVTITGRRPCMLNFQGDIVVAGAYSRPVYYPRRDPKWVPVGIRPPDQQVGVTLNGVGNLRGSCICYITFQHRIGDVLLAESNPSNYVVIPDLANADQRVWANLTTPRVEKRVTHVAGYCSVNGAGFRRAFLAGYGVQTYSESTSEASLTIQGPDSNYLPPFGTAYATVFANRVWYANTSEFPYRVWYSDAGQPQYVGVAHFFDTPDRDDITALAACQGVLIVFSIRKAYVIRASGSGFQIDRLDSSFGCLSHFGCKEIHNKLWFPSQDGIAIYDGASFYFVMKDIRPYWQADFLANPDSFLDSYAENDKTGKNYMLLTPRTKRGAFEDWSPGLVIYVGNYLNFERTMGGTAEQPDWSIDLRNRIDYSAFYGLDNRMYFGGEDGKLRIEDPLDPDDDGDTIQKALLIEHGCVLFNEPGDDIEHGKTLVQLWSYVESETTSWSMYVMMGDEWAGLQYQPDNVRNNWKIDVIPSGLVDKVHDDEGGDQLDSFIPDTVHYMGPEGVAGRGLVIRVRATAPVGFKYRGHGGAWAHGAAPRKAAQINRFRVTMDASPIVPNDATTRIPIAALAGQTFVVTLENTFGVTYPIAVDYTWSGDYVNTGSDPIAAGLASAGLAFPVAAGLSALLVQVTLGAVVLEKTFYFEAT